MPFSDEDKALIKNLHQFKENGTRRILAEFLEKTGKEKDWALNWKRLEKQDAPTISTRAAKRSKRVLKRT